MTVYYFIGEKNGQMDGGRYLYVNSDKKILEKTRAEFMAKGHGRNSATEIIQKEMASFKID